MKCGGVGKDALRVPCVAFTVVLTKCVLSHLSIYMIYMLLVPLKAPRGIYKQLSFAY